MVGINPKHESKMNGKPEQGTKVFHRADRGWAKKISPANRVEFRSREEAVKAGYRLCKVCRP